MFVFLGGIVLPQITQVKKEQTSLCRRWEVAQKQIQTKVGKWLMVKTPINLGEHPMLAFTPKKNVGVA